MSMLLVQCSQNLTILLLLHTDDVSPLQPSPSPDDKPEDDDSSSSSSYITDSSDGDNESSSDEEEDSNFSKPNPSVEQHGSAKMSKESTSQGKYMDLVIAAP